MENINNNKDMINRSGKVWAGLFIIVIGSLLLLKNFGLELPFWMFKWSTLLIGIGLFVGLRHNFRNSGWFVMVLIGAYFTLKDIFRDYNMSNVVFPIMLLVFGLYLILKPKNNGYHKAWKKRERFQRNYNYGAYDAPQGASGGQSNTDYSSIDYVESTNIFGGGQQIIYTKNLKGGELTAVFGGGDLNFTQADFEGEIIFDVTVVFGGLKIILPPHWRIKSEVTAIFGGIDDKRGISPIEQTTTEKLVIIRGVVLFGGLEIKSF